MHLIVLALALLAAVFSSGCSVAIGLPMVRFQSPEVNGPGLYWDAIEASTTQDLQLIDNYEATTLTVTNAITGSVGLGTAVGFGIGNWFDLSVDARIGSPVALRLKFQPIGRSRKDAKAGNFSIAASAGAIGGFPSGGASDVVGGSETARTYKWSSVIYGYEAAGLIGLRPINPALLYVGAFGSQMNYSGSINQTLTSSGANVGSASWSGTLLEYGANAGLELDIGPHFHMRFEDTYVFTRQLGGQQVQGNYVGILLGWII